MKGRTLITLVIVAAVLGGMAILTSHKKNRPMPSVVGQALLPELALDKVARVVIIANGATSTVARMEDTWGVAEKHNYPADFDKLKRALVKLADLKIGQPVEVADAQRAELQLTPETAAQLVLQDDAGQTLAALMLGANREAQSETPGRGGYPDGRFVSTDGGATVYLVADALYDFGEADPARWVNAEILNLTSGDIETIRITGPDRAAVELKRDPADNKLILAALAEGEAFDSSKVYSVESALSYLRFEDIADPALENAALGFDAPVIYEAKTKKGLLYVVTIGGKVPDSENRYARFSVAYADGQQAAPADETEDARKTREAEEAKVREEATTLNTRLAKWTYVLPSYKTESLTKQRADLLKPKTDAGTAADQSAGVSTMAVPDATATVPAAIDANAGEAAANK